ncbi:MAG: hypothetical protein KAQ83_00525 [Nanoarchaeota archaeon]|nr:hypothetical protein [Nanoarchaeota archaeon]
MKAKRARVDVYVPHDNDVIYSYNKIKDDSNYNLLYLVLATSGIRLCECLRFLRNYDESNLKKYDNFVVYQVSETRGNKSINNIYLPLFVYNQLFIMTKSYNCIRKKFRLSGCKFSPKYLRKWNYNFLIYQNVPESVSDFIQGRAGKSISARHYLASSKQAEFWYSKVCNQLETLLHNKQIGPKCHVDCEDTALKAHLMNKDYSEVQ